MKKSLTLKEKLKACLVFILDETFRLGLIESCPKCGSVHIIKTYSWEKQMPKGSDYHANYKCKKCGAEATVIEEWHY